MTQTQSLLNLLYILCHLLLINRWITIEWTVFSQYRALKQCSFHHRCRCRPLSQGLWRAKPLPVYTELVVSTAPWAVKGKSPLMRHEFVVLKVGQVLATSRACFRTWAKYPGPGQHNSLTIRNSITPALTWRSQRVHAMRVGLFRGQHEPIYVYVKTFCSNTSCEIKTELTGNFLVQLKKTCTSKMRPAYTRRFRFY